MPTYTKGVMNIDEPPWTRNDILEKLDEFDLIYNSRPIKDNQGGMMAPHMFAVWFMAKHLSPDLIVESGVWKGQSTWLLEKACPGAKLVSLDLNLRNRQYMAEQAIYSDKDFAEQNWLDVSDRSLVFFDDHQNAYRRLQQCKWFGFKHIIFEDNYPVSQGDCYSLKKAFANAGFEPAHFQQEHVANNVLSKIRKRCARLFGVTPISLTPQYDAVKIRPNDIDSKMLQKHIEVYYEFPPVFKAGKTRWGDDWDDVIYPTPEPLLDQPTKSTHEIFVEDAMHYTWICYVKLK
jgi:hypothetical protein